MRLTQASRYAIRALVLIGSHENNGFFTSEYIAGLANMSEMFLLKALKPLVSAGILRSLKGPGGGYQMPRPAALVRWEQFRLGWVEAWPPDTSIEKGQVIAVLARSLGLWWLNVCRIVSVVDEEGSVKRYGFAYGTLPDHAGSGEERFLVEWDRESDGVWYDILAFSRPRHLLARLGYPWLRRVQKRFARDSAATMRRSVAGAV